MFNTQLRDQLKVLVDNNGVKVKYPDGYKEWKQKFNYFHKVTKDVPKALDAIYGPRGGVTNYKGSIYRNSNVDIKKTVEADLKEQAKVEKRQSKSFRYLGYKKQK